MGFTAPTLVIGGGPAGAALAAHLAAAGQRVTLIERKSEPHDKVCGEFISGEAALYLGDLGIAPEALGAAEIDEVRMFAGKQASSARLPFPAFSLSRRVLDEALLTRASAAGAGIMRGQSAKAAWRDGLNWRVELDDGRVLQATDVFLATGKHDLRGWKRPPGRQSDLVAFKLHWRLSGAETEALRGAVELSLFPGGYAGLEMVEDGIANLCLVVRRKEFQAHGQSWDGLLAGLLTMCPHLRRRLAGGEACWTRPLAITAIPYGLVQRQADGLWRLGDQAACIPSFSGDGMSIALHSAQLAARCFLHGENAEAYQARMARDIATQVGRATLLSQMLVRPFGQAVGMNATRHIPATLSAVARATRIPPCRVRAARSEQAFDQSI